MIIDVRSDFPPEASVDCDVCIVGAGPAGMAVAMELADTGHRICLLEAGGMRYEAAVQQFNEGHVVGNRYPPLRTTRLSAFGGSSMLWAGWCRPLDPIDFEPRAWVANSGWPFGLDELRPHYRRAHDICRLGPFEYEVEPWQASAAAGPLSMARDSIRTTVFHVNPLKFGTEFCSQFEKAAHVRVLLHSSALRLHSESGDRRVESLTAMGPARREFRVQARYFVLAGGGIENARILLLSGDTPERSVGNQRGLVGRYFTEHPFIHPGYLIPADPRRSLAFYLPMTPGSAPPGASVRMTFSLTRDALERERLLNGTFVVRPAYEGHPVFDSPEVRAMLEVWEKLRGRGVPGGARSELTTAARAPHRLALAAWRKLTIRGTASPRWALRAFFEAESLATNRVTLSEELDSLGRPLPHVEWRLGELDVESMRRGFHLFDAELRKAGLGRLELRFPDDLEHWNREAFGGKHHMGTTRMHPSPDRGVVDADGKVHGTANLFVAGSSVFPTAGFANPTLTIVALSSRLGLHLRRLLEGTMHPDPRADLQAREARQQHNDAAPAISVIVASRNRCSSLGRFLRSLEHQVDPPPFEVVVADNGSADETPDLLAGSGTGLQLRSVRVDCPGKGKALNAAIRIARGQLLVLTDDDVTADPDWLSEIHRAALQGPQFNVFGGRIDVDRDRVPEWVAQSPWLMAILCSEHGWDGTEEVYPYGKYPFGPNMGVRRALVAGLESPYPEDMGPGTPLPVGDERAFLMKVSPPEARDRRLVSTAPVRHEVRPEYFTLRNAFLRCFHAGRSHGRIDVPLVPLRADGRRGSLVDLIVERVQGCGSVREFICFAMRQCGFLWGRRERARRRKNRPADPTSDSSGSPSVLR